MIIVQKFGGTSVKDDESRDKVLEKIISSKEEGNDVVVVVSAMGRRSMPYATDSLIDMVKEKCSSYTKKDMDMLMACGESISAVLISSLLNSRGYKAEAMNASSCGIITNEEFGEAQVKKINSAKLLKKIKEGTILVITGFQGITEDGDITTLGRGGSDTTASLIGSAINADVVEIYTDVNGVMTADPKICPKAKVIDKLPYDELFQMADSGAKVIHKDAAFLARQANIELRIKNTFTNERGTVVRETFLEDKNRLSNNFSKTIERKIFTGLASLDNRIKVVAKIKGSNDLEVFDDFAKAKISLDMINIFTNEFIFTIQSDKINDVKEILKNRGIVFYLEEDCSKVTVIGEMTGVYGVMNRILRSMQKNNIVIYQTTDSLVSISILIKTKDVKRALVALHDDLELDK